MKNNYNIYLGQVNPTVGDIVGNIGIVLDLWEKSKQNKCDLLLTPELMVSGYPPEDLILKSSFMQKLQDNVFSLIEKTSSNGPAIALGTPWIVSEKLYNSILIIDSGSIVDIICKHNLPNYGVFDEQRVFSKGNLSDSTNIRDLNCGFIICEDMWSPIAAKKLVKSGAEILITLNCSPFSIDKNLSRENYAIDRVKENNIPLIYLNQIGGQDELVFDGSSFIINKNLNNKINFPSWKTHEAIIKWKRNVNDSWECKSNNLYKDKDQLSHIYSALVIGLRDYVSKNKFTGVIVGLSGGIDSALTATIAVDALGPEKVRAVMMPSIYTSNESIIDAQKCAKNLAVLLNEISIKETVYNINESLKELFSGYNKDETEENIQARARGIILMAISNKLGYMVLTTGNKSEMSVGYATLYGDMCGGFSVLKDVYKTMVFDLCVWRNKNFLEGFFGKNGSVIPQNIIKKKPSAELRPNQTDQDSLPPYDLLDNILYKLVEKEESINELIQSGYDSEIVRRISKLLYGAEYKRRQAPPGVKISEKAFGRDRRYPITNKFIEEV
ncbi:NAD+ synthase [Alphaproteobacteria bacterium]|nr:NAD+ synthase [Alphaproteobacteria bacterium]